MAEQSDASSTVFGEIPEVLTVAEAAAALRVGCRLAYELAARYLAIGDVAVHEGDAGARAAVFTVSLSKASPSTVKVSFATAPGSALEKADYTTTTGTLSFAAGVTSMTVKVPIIADTLDEADKKFAVSLSGASGATITDANGVGTIIDDD